MATHINELETLYSRLAKVGINSVYVKKTVLPSWWEDEIAKLPTGLLQLKMHLSRHLGLDFKSLMNDDEPVVFSDVTHCNFKRTPSIDEEKLIEIKNISTCAAQIARCAMTVDYKLLQSASGMGIREQILKEYSVVSFPSLLDFCWKIGIPVLHLSKFPENVKKHVHGMAINVQDQPVIVITKESKKYAWLLFTLAHELGHVIKHHLAQNETLLDEKIDTCSTDQKEKEANEFALELLTGDPSCTFSPTSKWLDGQELAKAAQKYGKLHNIDAGHIVLNYGHTMNQYPAANIALNIIESNVDAVALIREKMQANLNLEQIPDDSAEFLFKVSAIAV